MDRRAFKQTAGQTHGPGVKPIWNLRLGRVAGRGQRVVLRSTRLRDTRSAERKCSDKNRRKSAHKRHCNAHSMKIWNRATKRTGTAVAAHLLEKTEADHL